MAYTVLYAPSTICETNQVPPVDMSMTLLIIFTLCTAFVHFYFIETGFDKYRNFKSRVMWTFSTAVMVLVMFMFAYKLIFPVKETEYTEPILKMRSTFYNVNKIARNFINVAFTVSYYKYKALVLSLFCLFSVEFRNIFVMRFLEYCAKVIFDSGMPALFDFDRFHIKYNKSHDDPVANRQYVFLWFIQRIHLFCWWWYTNQAMNWYGFATWQARVTMSLFTTLSVIDADIIWGNWNPVTLLFNIFDSFNDTGFTKTHATLIAWGVLLTYVYNGSKSIVRCDEWGITETPSSGDVYSVDKLSSMVGSWIFS